MSNKAYPSQTQKEITEKKLDSYYDTAMSLNDKLEHITIVSNLLKEKYAEYSETSDFINFLHAVEEVFAYAQEENLSVEETQKEMIESEIYIISRTTGIDEMVFRRINDEFTQANEDAEKIQSTASALIEKYTGDEDCPVCVNFITYIKDLLLVFSRTISGDTSLDEIDEAKNKIIQLRMEAMSRDGRPPLEILQKIYDDFIIELRKEK